MRKIISHDPRWNKDVRFQRAQKACVRPTTVPHGVRADDYHLHLHHSGGNGSSPHDYMPRGLSDSARAAIRRCGPSAVGRLPPPPTPPFRLGGKVGGSGTPGARAQRWSGRPGDAGWEQAMHGFEQAPAVRARLLVKAEFPHVPPPEPPFVRHNAAPRPA
jgi:hypothetical protein